jgi:hypothetical protein
MSKVTSLEKARSVKLKKAANTQCAADGFAPCSQDMTICGDCTDNRTKNKCPRLKEWLAKKERWHLILFPRALCLIEEHGFFVFHSDRTACQVWIRTRGVQKAPALIAFLIGWRYNKKSGWIIAGLVKKLI